MARTLKKSRPGAGARRPHAGLDPRLVKAISHPLRHRVLSRLNEVVASPKQLADEFGEPLPRLSYHVRILADLGCIELVDTAQRRGAMEHFYRALMRPWFDERQWETLPATARRSITDQHLTRIFQDVGSAAETGGFDFPDAHLSWTPLDLDEEGVRAMTVLLRETLERALEIKAESIARQIEREPGQPPPLATEMAMLHFMRAPSDGKKPTKRRSTKR